MSNSNINKFRRSSDDYIQLRKTVTNKFTLKGIKILVERWGLSPQDVCMRLICEGAIKVYEEEKLKEKK